MSVSKDDILETISNMTVVEVVDLIEAMEKKFGVTAAPVAVAATVGNESSADVIEQTEFDVVMPSFGANKVKVIKVVRNITSLGLKEAKSMVEGVPATIKEAIGKEEAKDVVKQLEEAGATAELR
ncbi:MAG: 50S ribosomal protein L7/L12 [Piscirickettsiaceae bacterium]|nr:50S ribosomal protein L7/L12 [Piscirickettsiaceae bacterium]